MEESEQMKWYAYGHDFGNTVEGGVLIKAGQQLKKSIPTAFLRTDTNAMKKKTRVTSSTIQPLRMVVLING